MAQQFQAGQVVMAASGGPCMTVVTANDKTVAVLWWPKTEAGQWMAEPESSEFPPAALKLAGNGQAVPLEAAPAAGHTITVHIGRLSVGPANVNAGHELLEQLVAVLNRNRDE